MNLDELVRRDEEKMTPETAEDFRRVWSRELKRMPKNSEIWPLLSDKDLVAVFKTRNVRTESGVAPMAVMMKPHYCPGNCVYCPLEEGMPKSYLSDEPAAQRAKSLDFDPMKQVEMRIKQLEDTGHITDKMDIIVVGGTFGAYPEDYKKTFLKGIYDGLNGVVSKSVQEAITLNQLAKHRMVGLSVETRPDWITDDEIKIWREFGVTKVQMGVQAFDNKILKKIERGHGLDEVAEATRKCRNAGIKICYHFMPNLPGSSPEKDVEMAKIMFEDYRFQPDYLKVYPAMVIPGTELYRMWKRGEYVSYSDDQLKEVLKKIKLMTPRWCRIDRLVRDISKKWVSTGFLATNMRQMLQEELKKEGKKCQCIRCREAKGLGKLGDQVKLLIDVRETLGGRELFLSFEDDQYLYAMLRLRLPDNGEEVMFKELINAAIIREVHAYGQVREIGKDGDRAQHRGLGKQLLAKAEKVAREAGYAKLAIISAVGTREYYAKQGYELRGTYMVKDL